LVELRRAPLVCQRYIALGGGVDGELGLAAIDRAPKHEQGLAVIVEPSEEVGAADLPARSDSTVALTAVSQP
jgi:hypothetical protein